MEQRAMQLLRVVLQICSSKAAKKLKAVEG
jgi:hypothetical protein